MSKRLSEFFYISNKRFNHILSIKDERRNNDDATTCTYILNNQGKQKTSRQIINSLSEMNGSDVLMGTQNSKKRKIARSLINKGLLTN